MKCPKLTKSTIVVGAVILAALLFALGSSALIFSAQGLDFIKWGSPDENANYVFTKLYGQTGQLKIFEKYNLIADCIIHPRSFRCEAGFLKPMSFLGIILIYGLVVRFSTYLIIPYLTPLVGMAGIIFYYLLIKKIFGRAVALLSALFLAVFPVYVYYSVRSMFHNVLFVVLLLGGFWWAVLLASVPDRQKIAAKKPFWWRWLGWGRIIKQKLARLFWWRYQGPELPPDKSDPVAPKLKPLRFWQPQWWRRWGVNFVGRFWSLPPKGWVYAFLGGVFFGGAVITRTSELLWLVPLWLVLWVLNWRRLGLLKPILILVALVLTVWPAAYYNQVLYGSPYYGGYVEMNSSLDVIKQAGFNAVRLASEGAIEESKGFLRLIKNKIFYFGYHPDQSREMFYYYVIAMFPYLWWPAVGGAVLLAIESLFRRHWHYWKYLIALVVLGVILVLYYGSWRFFDNPDATRHTIGNSYTRYWLPIYLGLIPLAAWLLVRASAVFGWLRFKPVPAWCRWCFRGEFFIWLVRLAVFALVAAFSLQFVLIGSEEGLLLQLAKARDSREQFEQVLNLTESNAIIVTQYHDKLFFPERKVIVGLFDDKNMIKHYARLAHYLPIYYYSFSLREKDIEYLNNRRLYEAGLQIRLVKPITSQFSLYQLTLR
ncbi:hypothetical protein D6821_00870 [Candidatus Parcubacteria bacterium]|nr:MAG: hypothetical protein D6821_00870 [Candidatus Parcubacteria bacterium]